TFAVTTGSLPNGLTLTTAGVMSGTPTTEGNFNFTITATDSVGCSGNTSYSVRICPASITVNPATLPGGTIGSSYNQTITASGGTSPFTFAVTSGSLPNGLTLGAGGALTGTLTTEGNFSFTITTSDFFGCNGQRSYNVRVCPVQITLSPTILPDG